jgi:hypothetical protein
MQGPRSRSRPGDVPQQPSRRRRAAPLYPFACRPARSALHRRPALSWPASPSAPFGSHHSSTELRQHAFRDLQLAQLVRQLSPFLVEPGKAFGNPSLLLSNLVQCRHMRFPSGPPDIGHTTPSALLSDNLRINARGHPSERATPPGAGVAVEWFRGDIRVVSSTARGPSEGRIAPPASAAKGFRASSSRGLSLHKRPFAQQAAPEHVYEFDR